MYINFPDRQQVPPRSDRPIRPAWAIGLVVSLVLAATAAASPTIQQTRLPVRPSSGQEALVPATVSWPKAPPGLDGRLAQINRIARSEGLVSARRFAAASSIPMSADGRVRVLVHANAAATYARGSETPATAAAEEALFAALEPAVAARITRLGGTVLGRAKNLIEAQVPATSLEPLTAAREIAWVQVAPVPRPAQVRSQGVGVTRATELHGSSASYRPPGQPLRVGVLDVGFRGYQDLLGTELPSSVVARSFSAGGISATDLPEIDAVHGTACAEIVHDMAPGADLFIANFDTVSAHSDAVDWLIEQNVDVISYSVGWTNAGPGDGRGPINDDVRRALDAGIEWVGAAGNDSKAHWQGMYSDPNGNDFHNFTANDETNSLFLFVGEPFAVFLSWDDWFQSDQDYDLFVLDANFGVVAASTGPQNGSQWPTEGVGFVAPQSGTYHVVVHRFDASGDANLEMFFVAPEQMQHIVPAGSLTIPADTEGAVAVGATYWGDDVIEGFSSLGPTTDGRSKPDIAAPDGVDTMSYTSLGFSFFGTSAATPHVAGAIALVKGRFGVYSLPQVRQILLDRAIDRGPAGRDLEYGEGRLDVIGE